MEKNNTLSGSIFNLAALPSKVKAFKFHSRIKSKLYIILLLIPLTIQTSCTTSSDVDIIITWEVIPELAGVTVKDMKVINDEIYVAGSLGNRGVVYRSKDGIKWDLMIPEDNYFDEGVRAVTSWGDQIVAISRARPITLITKDTLYPISSLVLIEVSEAITFNNGILIGAYTDYDLIYFKNDSLNRIQDYLYTYFDCVKQSGIGPVAVSKLILSEEPGAGKVLIGNYVSNHYVTSFYNDAIECFPHTGLDQLDKFFGVNDIQYINGELFAGGYARLMTYQEDNGWQQFGDSLPKVSEDFTNALALAHDYKSNKIYISTNYKGVFTWVPESGWRAFNSGINALQNEIYDSVPELIYFNDKLFLGYGDSKKWKSVSKGVLKYNLK